MSPLFTNYDVHFYELEVKIDPALRRIGGSNTIHFTAVRQFQQLQLGLHEQLEIARIEYQGRKLEFSRHHHLVLVHFPRPLAQGSSGRIKVIFGGAPPQASAPGEEGAFFWGQDEKGNPQVAVCSDAVGSGAWWPLKDHWSDRPDSMEISLIVPETLMAIANGSLMSQDRLPGNFLRYLWVVSKPMSSNQLGCFVGKYALVQDVFKDRNEAFHHLNYYVLPGHESHVPTHLRQVKAMLRFLEARLGPYPYWEDGFKMVETSYQEIMHYGGLAFHHGQQNNEFGFDAELLHQLAHEWFGGSTGARDATEAWVTEAFAAYMEVLFVEHLLDYDQAVAYLQQLRRQIQNREPLLGPADYPYRGRQSEDMHPKGAWMLHSLRNAVDDDERWQACLQKLGMQHRYRNLSSQEVIDFFGAELGQDYSWLFEQYLRHATLPVLEYSIKKAGNRFEMDYRWRTKVEGFALPVYIYANGIRQRLQPRREWQTFSERNVAERHFYIDQTAGLFELHKGK